MKRLAQSGVLIIFLLTSVGCDKALAASPMKTTLLVLRCLLGFLFISAALFLYEDGEGKIQNVLEESWIRLMYTRDSALSKEAAFIRGIARMAGRGFDSLLGDRLWSFQMVGVSICFSLASFFLVVLVGVSFFPHRFPNHPSNIHTLLLAGVFIFLGALPTLIGGRLAVLVWTVCFVSFAFMPLVVILRIAYRLWGLASLARLLGILFLMVSLNFGFDVLYIVITRRILRMASEMRSVWRMLGIIFLDCLLAAALVFGPIEGGAPILRLFPMFGFGIMLVVLGNFVDILACSVVFILMAFMLAHRLLWPLLERPVYACQRYGIIRRKKMLWAIGLAFWFGPSGWNLLKFALEKVG